MLPSLVIFMTPRLLGQHFSVKPTGLHLGDVPYCSMCTARQLVLPPTPIGPQPNSLIASVSSCSIFAAAGSLFHMLTGRVPFDADSPGELLEQKQHGAPRILTEVLECPVWLDTLVSRLLDPAAEKRPQSAAAVITALRETKRLVGEKASVAVEILDGGVHVQRRKPIIPAAASYVENFHEDPLGLRFGRPDRLSKHPTI